MLVVIKLKTLLNTLPSKISKNMLIKPLEEKMFKTFLRVKKKLILVSLFLAKKV